MWELQEVSSDDDEGFNRKDKGGPLCESRCWERKEQSLSAPPPRKGRSRKPCIQSVSGRAQGAKTLKDGLFVRAQHG